MPERLYPLIHYVDLSTKRGMIAIVWLIRQSGEITYPDLYKEVFGQTLDQSDDGFRTPAINLQQVFAFHHDLRQLFQNGLIETNQALPDSDVIQLFQSYDASSSEANIKLRVSKRIGFIQHLFDLSLTEITLRGIPVKSHPIFGNPLEIIDDDWSDVFVIMPFNDQFHDIYTQVIKPAVQDVDLTIRRGDDFYSGQRIMDEVWSSIYHSKLCIVECTNHNPNVFYELGIAHMLGKPTIMLTEDGHDIPFDIHDRRVLFYQTGEAGFTELKATLQKTIKAEMQNHYGDA